MLEPKRTILTLAISVRGDWTDELYQKILDLKMHTEKFKRRKPKMRKKAPRRLIFKMDGPFPSPMESILAQKRVILIGAGIGATAFISAFNYLM